MRSTSAAVLFTMAIIIPTAALASDPRETLTRWEKAFNAGQPDEIVSLYTGDAKLWGTVSPGLTVSPDSIKAYFDNAAKAGLKVRFADFETTRLSDGAVVIAGRYAFERPQDGKMVELPARYSFVLVQQSDDWKIAHQHSSPMPRPAP